MLNSHPMFLFFGHSTPMLVSLKDIFHTLGDERSLYLFNLIARAKDNGFVPSRIEMKLTKKQFYYRLSELTLANLVRRKKGKYYLTILGKIVYYHKNAIENSLAYLWTFKAIDSMQLFDEDSEEIRHKTINILIDDQEIKKIIAANSSNDFSLHV
jgi:hypothetical protein